MTPVLSHKSIGAILLAAFVACGVLGPLVTLLAIAAVLGAWIFFRWPQYGVALLVAGTVSNLFGVASNVHGLPGIQVPLTFALAAVLLIRWVSGKEDLAAARIFAPLLICAFGVSLLSLVHIENLDPTLEKLIELAKDLTTVVVIIAFITSRERLLTTIRATVLCLGVIALVSVRQYLSSDFGNDVYGLAQASIKQIAGEVQRWRISGTLPDPNYYGQVLVMALPLACCLAIIEKRVIVRIAYLLCALAILAASLFTFSRGALFAIAVMVVAATLTLRARWKLLGAACVLAAVGIIALPSAFVDRVALIAQAAHILITGEQAVSDPSLNGRIAVMSTALRIFADHPFVGIGLGQYAGQYGQYALASGVDPGAAPHPHNLFLETLSEEGILGFAKLAALVVIPLMVAIRAVKLLYAKGENRDAAIATSLCIGFIGYLATAIFLHGAFMRFFWIEIALLLSLWQVSAAVGQRSGPVSGIKGRSSKMLQRALLPADVLGIVRQRKVLIAGVTLAFMLVPLVQSAQSVAESTLLYRFGREYFPIRPGEERRNWGENVQVSLDAALFTEMHLLRSREVMEATVNDVGLDKLTPSRDTFLSGVQSQVSGFVKGMMSLGGLVDFGSSSDVPKRAVDPVVAAAKDLSERLRIRRVEGAALIAVGIQDPDPEVAEKIITAHVESYLRKRQQLFERDPSKFYSSEIEKAQTELNGIAEKITSLRLEQGVPDESIEHSVLSDRLIALERQRQGMRQPDVPVLQKDLKDTREALFDLNSLTAATKLLEGRYKSVAENLERMLQEQSRWRLDNAYVRELGPTIEIVEPAAFSARPSGLSRPMRMILGGAIGFLLVTGFLVGMAMIGRRKESVQPEPMVPETLEPPRVKVYSNPSSLS
ncbi:O-antigen ligase family protein [Microvirga zambiensis]|uniref:O-antigen ligase family protein n=1 Tax=Microvirga zambiensis TaxID=1402137 RepID=UPI00191DAB2B|nr:O-antigen ligase family protein [Microvirga zambiensis]